MISRLTKGQILAFLVLAVVLLTYASISYVKLPRKLGIGRYSLSVELPNSSDLYERAIVTLRGQPIGEVTALGLTDQGVRATLSIDDAASLPKSSEVTVRSVSAIGEQYLNFDPRSDSGPRYGPGDVVPATQVRLPTAEDDLVRDATQLVASLPAKDLATTVDELSKAFSGSADGLQRLVDSSSLLVDSAQANLDPTQRLIEDLNPVLRTQQRLSPQIHSIAGDLGTVTDQLRRSDGDLRGVIEKTGPFADEIGRLFNQLDPTLPMLLSDLTDVAQVLRVYLPNIRHTVVVLPTTINDVESSIYHTPMQGSAKLNFKFVVNDPPPCTVGFNGAHQRSPHDLTPGLPDPGSYCKEPHDSRVGVRMGHNDPCPNNPRIRSRTAAGCGLNFQSPQDAKRASDQAIDTMMEVAGRQPTSVPRPKCAPPPDPGGVEPDGIYTFGKTCDDDDERTGYDQGTGMLQAPDGQPYLLGRPSAGVPTASNPAASDWRTLLLDPMGLPRR